MKINTTILLLLLLVNVSSAQKFRFYHTNNTPKVLRPWTTGDTLLNPFAGGLNAPQFSNIDWNNDGINDLFIFDKEARKVYSFIFENGRFVYRPQYEAGFPFYLFGFANLKDHNNDGKPDLFTAAFSHNTIEPLPEVEPERIQMFVNRTTDYGNPVFTQYANMVYDTGCYIGYPWFLNVPASPIPSVATAYPAIEDIDNDGDLDILSNIGLNATNVFYENVKKNKFGIPFDDDTVAYLFRDQCWGYISYNFDNYFNLAVDRNTNFNCQLQTWGKKASRHADQVTMLIDLNGDGIKDVVVGDFEHKSLVSLINGRLLNSMQADSIISQDTLFLSTGSRRREFIQYPAPYYVDVTGDNKPELLITTNSTMAPRTVNNIWMFDATRVNSNLQFTELPGNDFLYRDMLDHGLRSVPVFVDIDSDGDQDLVVATSGVLEQTANNNDLLYLYLNITDSLDPVFQLADSNFADISGTGPGFFFAHPTFGDLNADGKPDLLVGDGNGNIAYFENTSTVPGKYTFSLVSRNAFGIMAGSYATPQLVDLDKDGLLDIVSGNTAGTVMYFRNKGTAGSPSFSPDPDIDSLGKIVTKEVFTAIGRPDFTDIVGHSTPHVVDLDRDGRYELLSGSSNGVLHIYGNIFPHRDSVASALEVSVVDFGKSSKLPGSSALASKGVSVDFGKSNHLGYNKRFGARNSVATAYLDGDQELDIVMGNIAGGLTFLSTRDGYNGLADRGTVPAYLRVFPNPASSVLYIESDLPAGRFNYEIRDVMGRLIRSGKTDKAGLGSGIALDDINQGLYFFILGSGDRKATTRFIISR